MCERCKARVADGHMDKHPFDTYVRGMSAHCGCGTSTAFRTQRNWKRWLLVEVWQRKAAA